MIKSKGIFAVSFIAMMVVGGAYANIASQGYVDQQVDAKQNASTAVKVAAAGTAVGDATHPVYVNASGVATRIDKVAAATSADTATSATKATQDASGNVITTTYATKTELNAKADAEDIPTVNNATLTIQKNGTAVATFTANSATGATANITVPTKVSELTNDSGFITAASLPGEYELKPATADALGGVKSGGDITVASTGAVTVSHAAKADTATSATSATKATQDASGNVITSTYATKTELSAKQNASTAVEVATAGTAVGDSTHPVYVNASGVATKIDKVAAAAKADTATSATSATTATTATNATNATNDADGNEITETYATKTEVGSKLSSISGSTGGTGNVVTSVSASGSTVSATKGITAEETKNKVKSVRAAASATDTAYPSEKAVATALATKANTSALSGYATNTRVDAVEDKAEAAQTAASAAQTAANSKVATAQGPSAANKAVITNSSGNITTGTISSGMIANDAVTAAKIATGAVGTDGLAANAVTSAKIDDGTIVNADIASNAAIAASKISGLATVATSGSYDDLADKPTIPAAITVDSALSSTSTNPVQNKVINTALAGKLSTTGTAAKATADANGNNIADTYATKAQLTALDSTSSGSGAVVTDVSQTDGKVSVTKGNVQIPVGSATATTYATIWVQ